MDNHYLKCPHCGDYAEDGVSVCRGCGAEIVYGPTGQETMGFGCFTVIAAALIVGMLGLDSEVRWWWALPSFIVGAAISNYAYGGVRFIRLYRR